MPQAVVEPQLVNPTYPTIGNLKQDRWGVLHANTSPTDSYLPGEPFLKRFGDEYWVVLTQKRIGPGKVRTVLFNWLVELPCAFTGDVNDNDYVYWNPTTNKVTLEADKGIDGFLLGTATFILRAPATDDADPEVDVPANYPGVADANSQFVQVLSLGRPSVYDSSS